MSNSAAPRTQVIVVGSVNVDLTATGTPVPSAGETRTGDHFAMGLGGKGANQAVAAARAGASTKFVGCVGDDTFAVVAIHALREAGVSLGELHEVDGTTGVAHIRVDAASGDNSIFVIPGANAALTPERAVASLRAVASEAVVVLLQLEVPLETVVAVAAAAGELGLRVVLDPAPARELPASLWHDVEVVTPNEHEAGLLSGIEVTDDASAERAGRWFLERGASVALITRGAAGASLVTSVEVGHLRAAAVDAVDTTAAGDSFAGHLGAALAAGAELRVAVTRALAAGSLAATRPGASESIPTRDEVDRELAARR
ncbi:ribokinase [Gulosibacter sp. ACHW.36C]|uniref:Ribokinase n=1 Tax=Gulosibacter sediminis TaxID=1729695 RepID=A0ABY4MZX0_9MICO|nr:ribokinase [Gulosibacter sediminis]UQN15329.1 ribokinase [Gulosibacter sediminis]